MRTKKTANQSGRDHFNYNHVMVSATIHLPRELIELLRDVSLVRPLRDVGLTPRGKMVKSKSRPEISDVIQDLVKKNRDSLMGEPDLHFGRKRH